MNRRATSLNEGDFGNSYLLSKSVLGLINDTGDPSDNYEYDAERRENLENNDKCLDREKLIGDIANIYNYVSDSYHQAVKLFLNRKFVQCHKTLKPVFKYCKDATIFSENNMSDDLSGEVVPRSLVIRVWGLYLALFDVAAKIARSDDGTESHNVHKDESLITGDTWSKMESLEFLAMINDHRLWDFIIDEVCQRLSNVPASIMVALTLLSLRYGTDFNKHDELNITDAVVKLDQNFVASKLEEYIIHINIRRNLNNHANDNTSEKNEERTALKRLLNIYILQVLPSLNEFDYARKFIDSNRPLILANENIGIAQGVQNDEGVIQSLFESLNSVELQAIDRKNGKKQESIELKQRKMKKKHSKCPSRRLSQAQSSPQPETQSQSYGNPTPIPSKMMNFEDRGCINEDEFMPQGPFDLLLGFKRSLLQCIRIGKLPPKATSLASPKKPQLFCGTNFLYQISALIFLVTITMNKKYRQKLSQILPRLWTRLVHTVRMGTKVSYV
ncbi:hypothetical protein NADFUDRAFT_66925 [Nadsonia fulvescens var. elongata DSM 6958]|uniref:Uncharacterized protein n=1 Tax=Nadsonia fulvescens var. elongata DSM 6958 TaxID=857566 RepID=A0A1E3PFI9_9ASCO|nr:hypothetical protein NADFUDRAFT_66925 [Nadsonia fulvescens var. elongata DSM 6958]